MTLASFCFWPVVYIYTFFVLSFYFEYPHVATTAMPAHHGNETDRLALLAFKNEITGDPSGVLSSWNDSINFCLWHGVKCGRRHQRVTTLDLGSQKLTGSVSRYVGNLSFLRELYLENNSFTQEIPQELGRLKRVQTLWLFNNSIGGQIPGNLSGCSNLLSFALSNNQLVGNIPAELSSLTKLEYLYLSNNILTGEIPLSFGNFSALVVLELNFNAMSGGIPKVLGQLTKLESFLLAANNFSGTIPSTIFNLSHLKDFEVSFNQIQGRLPSNMGVTLPNLEYFGIIGNQFMGHIPASFSNASQLAYFFANKNKLTGQVPSLEKLHNLCRFSITSNHLGTGEANDLSFISSLTNSTSLQDLLLNGNSFGGMFPKSFGNLSTTLAKLWVDNNHISGSIPNEIGNLINLEDIQMSNNQLIGTIPDDFGRLLNLRALSLELNKISGKVPSSIGNLSFLTRLYLRGNNLQGDIPSSLGECKSLQVLDLSKNNLNGTIPRQIFHLSSLSLGLDLSDNQLVGSIPLEIGDLKSLGSLDVSNNLLTGEIPSSLSKCVALENLEMGGNFFQGTIPGSFSSLRGLQHLDLSQNNLSGQIPEFFEAFDLKYLNLSFNDFEGAVPTKGVFKNASATFVHGNRHLCGGVPQQELPLCIFKRHKKRKLILSTKLIVPAAIGLLGLTLIFCFLIFSCLRKRREHHSVSTSEYALLRVSYQGLLKATNGFSSFNLIGAGSFGSVYRGVLEDGKDIAVKVLYLNRHGALKSFMAECEALRNIRHRNLVRVLSACSGIDYQGNDFKAVVYELMVNGSLEEWLHSFPARLDAETRKNLNLLQRLNIAIDVASALDYLQNQCQTPIVHCDIKPSNVLLDSDMTAHVGDFGLARLLLEETNVFTTNQSSSLAIKGTVGYAPPEYGMGREVSTAGDVYSYGILLLEMFTGKRPTDDMFSGDLNLHNFVKTNVPEQVAEISDAPLLERGEREESRMTSDACEGSSLSDQKIDKCLISIYRVGVACSSESPRERMDISHVKDELLRIRNNFIGTEGMYRNSANAMIV